MKQYNADLIAENIRPEHILPTAQDIEQLAGLCRRVYYNFAGELHK
jgi:hypothetical protein